MADSDGQSEAPGASARARWHDAEADLFLAQLASERLIVAKQRFAGDDPTVKGPSGKTGARMVARILAADREGALVETGGGVVNPAEDRAEEALQRAINALSRWQFDTASRDLGEVSALSRSLVRQQRASLIRALLRLVRTLVSTTPGDRLRPEDAAVRTLLRGLDVLSIDEREHYEAEVQRLVGHWREAATDDEAWRAWALLRGRIAMRDGAGESAMAWAIRTWDRQTAAERETDPGLAHLLDAARLVFSELAGYAPPEDAADPPHPWDVLLAVAGTLAARTDDPEPFGMTQRFSLVRWHEPPVLTDGEAAL
ncbi:MAG TPA: hypothetical protein VGR16_14750 [Thermomicrobiales bacterium]|nr:hypothetical protein [Thermomicrobiales bacterium]